MNVLVTGTAGFIGSYLVKKFLQTEPETRIVGLDNLNDYYDVSLKRWRLEQLVDPRFLFVKGNLADKPLIESLFSDYSFDIVVNLAAQTGVRNSITKSGCLHPIERHRFLQHSGSLSAQLRRRIGWCVRPGPYRLPAEKF